jgi:hypothetical protein
VKKNDRSFERWPMKRGFSTKAVLGRAIDA